MHIAPAHRVRQASDADITGLVSSAATVSAATETGPLAFDSSATGVVTGVPIVSNSVPVITDTSSTSSSTSSASTPTSAAATSSTSSDIPIGVVIGACVGAFVGLAILICLFWAWYKRSSDKLSASQRRNAQGQAEQQRSQHKDFNRLGDSEKPQGFRSNPPAPISVQEQQESDEKNFSMFKKSPSIRTAYTTKTVTEEEHAYDLPKLDFTKYHPTLAQELALEQPDKPFAAAAQAARQNSGVSWDGETLGDESFLSMRSVRVESGTMSPTVVMAKMTPPATASALHRWESAEVITMEDPASTSAAPAQPSRNPFADMAEERKARSNNPFFNAQDITRTSRVGRSRSNSRTSRTSRAQSIVRPDSRVTVQPNTNPFLELTEALPTLNTTEPLPPLIGLPTKPRTDSDGSWGNERAMASLIAALDLTKEQVEERLRVVSMQGSTVSAYSEATDDDALTVREFPLPPGTDPRQS